MALGGPVVRQHYVEFIRGTGVKLDGVVDGTSTNGPWTWVVPKDVSQIFVTGVGAGGGGAGSATATPSARGSCGGASGLGVTFLACAVTPDKSLTVTVGAKGTGGATGNGTAGGATTITNLVYSPIDNTTTLDLKGGGLGGTAGAPTGACNIGSGPNAAANAATPAAGSASLQTGTWSPTDQRISACGGASSGGASTTGSVNGANGGGVTTPHWLYSAMANLHSGGTGDNTGTVSRSGGGCGAPSIMGYGGDGGDGGAAGSNATGYGSGGGGAGGGGAAGGNGADGYIGIFYWSAD
jgi:hypothetical protein